MKTIMCAILEQMTAIRDADNQRVVPANPILHFA